MSGDKHPAPARGRLSALGASLLLYTGPIAWLVQICIGDMMTSWPCFPGHDRRDAPLAGYGWTYTGALVLVALCAVLAAAAGYAAWRKFAEVRGEREGGHDALAASGQGRTRFLALWGMYLGLGFALATLVTFVAFLWVPSCLG